VCGKTKGQEPQKGSSRKPTDTVLLQKLMMCFFHSREVLKNGDVSVQDQNKRNLHYFESSSMRGLYDSLENWQNANEKRFLSMSVQQDNGKFCCIALTNPTEVVITSQNGGRHVEVVDGRLWVDQA